MDKSQMHVLSESGQTQKMMGSKSPVTFWKQHTKVTVSGAGTAEGRAPGEARPEEQEGPFWVGGNGLYLMMVAIP